MLKNLSGKVIKEVPYKKELDKCKARMTSLEIKEIKDMLNEILDEAYNNADKEKRIVTSSWIPGNDWTGTPFEIIYAKGAQKNGSLAAMYFGLILMETVSERKNENWVFMKAESDDIKGSHYFREHNTSN